jgi:arylsulfatase
LRIHSCSPNRKLGVEPIPYEFATITSNTYWDWYIDHAWILYPLPDVVGEFLVTFKEFPPRQKAASFTIGDALETLQHATR